MPVCCSAICSNAWRKTGFYPKATKLDGVGTAVRSTCADSGHGNGGRRRCAPGGSPRRRGRPVHRCLAVGSFAQLAAVLSRHSHRLDPVLGDVGVINHQYSLAFAQRGRYQLPVRCPSGAWRRNSCCMCTALASAEEGRVARMIDLQPPGSTTILLLEQPLAEPSEALGVTTEGLDLLPKLLEDDEAAIASFDVMVLAE